jgi:DNA-binding XRE family transcriptional regulator
VVNVTAMPSVGKRHDGAFHTRIREKRSELGKSQAGMARLVGVSVDTYKNWENERSVPWPGDSLTALANILRVSVTFLLWGGEEPE